MGLLEIYNRHVYEFADLRTRDWPLLGDIMPVLFIIVVYLYIVKKAGPIFMQNREPYDLKRIIQVYNIIQVICCFLIIRAIYIHTTFLELIVGKMPDTSYNYHPVQQTKICWWLLCLKIFDLIETVFFVLRKKYNQASLLHLHHHLITLFMAWVLSNYYPGGAALFPVQLNTFIHFIMYIYYFLSTLGPSWQKLLGKWKNKLTILQMVQFTIMLIHGFQIFFTGVWRELPVIVLLIAFPNLIFIFKNFYDFYQDSYVKQKKN